MTDSVEPVGRDPRDAAEIEAHEFVRHLEALQVRLEGSIARLERLAPVMLSPTGPELPADVEARRDTLRPPVVRLLFVTEPIFPEDETNFYHANSHLYRCVRGAFVRALGSDVPAGDDFLRYFRSTGSWLVHMAPEPKRGRGRPSRATVRNRVQQMVEVLRAANPERVIGVKARIAPILAAATEEAGLAWDRVEIFPTPRALWTQRFVRELRAELGYATPDSQELGKVAVNSLLAAIERCIRDHQNRRLRALEIADEINERGLFRGLGFVSKAAVSAEIRKNPDQFDVNSAGVRLRALDAFPTGHPARISARSAAP